MKHAFVTLLATEDFLPGILALNRSLRKFNKDHDLVVMVTNTIPNDVVSILEAASCKIHPANEIPNPNPPEDDERGFRHMYTKLRAFDLTDYDKIVYLDSDMIVCCNIEELFSAPHMSAVVAGGLMPENSAWDSLNAGLLVIEPSARLYSHMSSVINNIGSIDGSDQGFLQLYYPAWPMEPALHLPHKFNVPFICIDAYCEHAGFTFSYTKRKLDTDIAIIHYWGAIKPWHFNIKTFSRRDKSMQTQAIILWWDLFNEAVDEINDDG